MELDQELSGETAYNDEHAENAECHNQAKNTIHDPAEDQAEKIEDSNCQETEDTEGSNDHETSSSESEPLVFSDPVKSAEHTRLPVWRMLAFSVGSIPYAMLSTVLAFYFSLFLLEVALLDPIYVLIIMLLGRVWDAVTDPMIGYLCSLTRTRIGQFKPWIIVSVIPVAVVYFFLWFPLDSTTVSVPVRVVYYLILLLLYQTTLTCVHVPYTALTVHMSYNQKEVDKVTMFRMTFETIGTLLGIAVYALFFGTLARNSDHSCATGVRIPSLGEIRAYRYHALALSVITVLCLAITIIFVKEQKGEAERKNKISFLEGIKFTFGFYPFKILICLEMFSWLALQFATSNYALYIKYSLGLGSQYPYIIALLLVCTCVSIPLWQIILLKFGKKTTFCIGLWMLLPLLISQLYLNYIPLAVYPAAMLAGMSVASFYLVPWSMVPDVIDAATMMKGTRREELFYSFFVFGNKFSAGIAIAISTGIYKLGGYDQLACDQPWTVPLMFKILNTVPTFIFILISLIFLHLYPIDEKKRREIRETLAATRSSQNNDHTTPNNTKELVTKTSENLHRTDLYNPITTAM